MGNHRKNIIKFLSIFITNRTLRTDYTFVFGLKKLINKNHLVEYVLRIDSFRNLCIDIKTRLYTFDNSLSQLVIKTIVQD